MPVYEFRCPECLEKEEDMIPMANRTDTRFHSCGAVMENVMSVPRLAVLKVYGNDTMLDTLNAEEKRPYVDGTPVRSKRSKDALTRGLGFVKPVIGTGF